MNRYRITTTSTITKKSVGMSYNILESGDKVSFELVANNQFEIQDIESLNRALQSGATLKNIEVVKAQNSCSYLNLTEVKQLLQNDSKKYVNNGFFDSLTQDLEKNQEQHQKPDKRATRFVVPTIGLIISLIAFIATTIACTQDTTLNKIGKNATLGALIMIALSFICAVICCATILNRYCSTVKSTPNTSERQQYTVDNIDCIKQTPIR